MHMPADFDTLLLKIAAKHVPTVTTLVPRGRDSLDFHTVSCWAIRAMLAEAYTLGLKSK